MDEVILARHGESEFSVRGAINCDPSVECGLTDAGRAQARRLGELLRDEPIELCITSTFTRVKQTADVALAGRTIPRLEMPDLDDIRVGDFEGRPLVEFRAWIREHGVSATPPGGGESRAETVARYARAFRSLLDRSERLILAVAHGLPIHLALMGAAGEVPTVTIDQSEYATPHRLGAEELRRAADMLAEWARERIAA